MKPFLRKFCSTFSNFVDFILRDFENRNIAIHHAFLFMFLMFSVEN